jgi:PhnB protein
MAEKVKAVPEGVNTITPHLSVQEAAKAIEFYQQAFGAQLAFLHKLPNGRVIHATMKLGDSRFQLADEFPGMGTPAPPTLGGSPVVLNICVENVDELFNRAVAAGAKVTLPLANQFWGARYGQIVDPFGHSWALFSHVEDVSPEELKRRGDAAFAEMAEKQGHGD